MVGYVRDMPRDEEKSLVIADFCTGSGCIALLIHSRLKTTYTHDLMPPVSVIIRGYDNSHSAIALAVENLQHNLATRPLHKSAAQDIRFGHVGILSLAQEGPEDLYENLFGPDTISKFDIMISNPPNLPLKDFQPGGMRTRSQRKYLPRNAHIPPSTNFFPQAVDNTEDQSYAALLRIAAITSPKVLVIEVADTKQALRVAKLCRDVPGQLKDQSESGGGTIPSVDRSALLGVWRDDRSVVPIMDNAAVHDWPEDEGRHILVIDD